MTNGSVYWKSLYCTLKADSHSPTPRDVNIANKINAGNQMILTVGTNPIKSIIPMRMAKAMAKSTRGDRIPESGMIILGKYTLVMIFEFVIMLFVDRVTPSAKRVHGSKAE